MKSNQKFKKKGIMLLSAVLAAFLLTLVASGYFMTLNGSFNAIRSGGEAMQAQRYAEIEANKLSLISYNDLDSKVSQNVWKVTDADDEWEYKVNLDPEKIIDPNTGTKQRIATVSVRKDGDSTDRFSIKIPLSENNSSDSGSIGDEKELVWYKNGDGRGVQTTIKESGFLYLNLVPHKAGSSGGNHGNHSSSSGASAYLNGREIVNSNTSDGNLITVPVKKGDLVQAYQVRGSNYLNFLGWCVGERTLSGCNGHWENQGGFPGGIGIATFRPLKR